MTSFSERLSRFGAQLPTAVLIHAGLGVML